MAENVNLGLEKDVKALYQSLSGHLLPKSGEVNAHIRGFLEGEIADFERLNHHNDEVYDELRREWEQYNKMVSELKSKKNKDSKFIEGGAGYLNTKSEEVKAKNKVLESISTGLKESVSKIQPLKLAKLPYDKQPILKDVFSTLFHVLYNEQPDKFDWPQFRLKALLHLQGEDFLTRLANVNFRDLSGEHYDALRVLKSDQKFMDVCENSEFAIDIVDIADWTDYVVEGQKVSLERKQAEHDYDKIRKDIDRRSDGTLQLKEEFCNETLKDIDHYQNCLSDLQSELRTLVAGMKTAISQLADTHHSRNEQIRAVNSI